MSSSSVRSLARPVWEGRIDARQLYRALLRELRMSEGGSVGSQEEARRMVKEQFRQYQTTQRQHCKASEELRHLGGVYECYLRHQRLWARVHQEYHGKGERSVAETAKIVGFKLPHDPK